jgi:lysyl endopeptidase
MVAARAVRRAWRRSRVLPTRKENRMRLPLSLPTLLLALTCLPASAASLTPELADLDTLPLHAAPAAVTAKAIDAARQVKGAGPALFAVNVALPVSLDGGVWDQPQAGLARWRTRLHSTQAQALLVEFSRFDVPAGAALWLYDAEGRIVQGPYTAANHHAHAGLWTAMVPGETAVIELQVAAAQREAVRIEIARVGHAWRNARDLGSSGACNIDTVCPLGNGWRDEIRATVKLQIPAGLFVGLCSGTLVNNTAQDGRPYILTADHCGIGALGSPASGVVVYWNFANSSCGGNADAVSTQNQTGAVLRADDRGTDMTLIELTQMPSAAFNVHYAGWDASGAGGNSGVSIHHPSGDAKKISEFTLPLRQADVRIEAAGPEIPAWEVQRWNQGTTEPGSSGSGLWNQNRRLVGVLSGGSAACEGNVDNDQSDFYARLDRQWQAGSSASSQLKPWLDPIGSGALQVAGKNAGGASGGGGGGGSGGSGSGGGGGTMPAALLALLAALAALRHRSARRQTPAP